MSKEKFTSGPYRWLSSATLVADHGKRPVILTTPANGHGGSMRTRDAVSGLLRDLVVNDPIANLLAAAPQLYAACALLELFADVPISDLVQTIVEDPTTLTVVVDHARAALAVARGETT